MKKTIFLLLAFLLLPAQSFSAEKYLRESDYIPAPPPVNLTPYATDADLTAHNADVTAHPAVHFADLDIGGLTPDGVQCLVPTEVQINSGPELFTMICADNDGSTINGSVKMVNWNAGTVTFGLKYIQTAADTGALNSDIACACRGAGETVNNTWGTEVPIDDAAVTGSNGEDYTVSGAATCNGTCAEGDTLYFRWQMDAAGTTTAVATLNIRGVVINYTGTVGN